MDMADLHPQAQVTGIDISPIQPLWVPPNCHFEIEDIEQDWLVGSNFDYIFGRELLMSIRDWPKLISQAYEHLNPGGWLELEMTFPKVACPDKSFDYENSGWMHMQELLFTMAQKKGTPFEAVELWKEQFGAAGFTDVEERILQIPIGPWYASTFSCVPLPLLLQPLEVRPHVVRRTNTTCVTQAKR